MVNFIPASACSPSLMTSSSSATMSLHQTTQRRKMITDLARVQDVLNRFNMDDSLSKEIRRWHTNFTQALKERRDVSAKRESDEARFERMLSTHLSQMQELLRDPITNTPLDKEAVLGSDGEVYGLKALYLAIYHLPREFQGRSPKYPDHPAIFTKKDHPVAQHMVRFLEEWNALEIVAELEYNFKVLCDEGPLPTIPETVTAAPTAPPVAPSTSSRAPAKRFMTIADLHARDAEERKEVLTSTAEVPQPEAPSHPFLSDEDLANFRELIGAQEEREAEDARARAEQATRFERRLEHMVNTVRAGLQAEFEPIRQQRDEFAEEIGGIIRNLQQQDEDEMRILQRDLNKVKHEIANVEHEIQHVARSISGLQSEILQAKKEELELEKEIQELRMAIKKRKKSNFGAVFGALALVGACVGFTVLAGSVAQYWGVSSGVKMAAMPMKIGAKVALRIPDLGLSSGIKMATMPMEIGSTIALKIPDLGLSSGIKMATMPKVTLKIPGLGLSSGIK